MLLDYCPRARRTVSGSSRRWDLWGLDKCLLSQSGMYHPVFCSERWDETHRSFILCCLFRNRLLKVTFGLLGNTRSVNIFWRQRNPTNEECKEFHPKRNNNNMLYFKGYCYLNSWKSLGPDVSLEEDMGSYLSLLLLGPFVSWQSSLRLSPKIYLYLMYDVSLQDLKELENDLFLIHSPFIWRNGINNMENNWSDTTLTTHVDQVGIPMDLWSTGTVRKPLHWILKCPL